ncbi:MAG: toll/interleukin-1 receptor domain-containing protein [Chthoniobacteraceae bacterium]
MRETLPPNSIFICYRRLDSEEMVDRAYEDLRPRFTDGAIFRDVDTIPAGVDFPTFIQQSLRDCAVVLVFIGHDWPNATDSHGQRRLEDPCDHVRIEIETALGLPDVRVIPVMVKRAAMPAADLLPEGLRALRRRNGRVLRSSGADYKHDLEDLAEVLSRSVNEVHAARKAARQRARKAVAASAPPALPKAVLRPRLHAAASALRQAGKWSWMLGAGCVGLVALLVVEAVRDPDPVPRTAAATAPPVTPPPATPAPTPMPTPFPATPAPEPVATPSPPAESTPRPKSSSTAKPKTKSPSRGPTPFSIPKLPFKKPRLPF